MTYTVSKRDKEGGKMGDDAKMRGKKETETWRTRLQGDVIATFLFFLFFFI